METHRWHRISSVRDALLLWRLYAAGVKDGTLRAFFYEGLPSRFRFVRMYLTACLRDTAWLYVALSRKDGTPLCMALVNGFEGHGGFCHMNVFRAGLPLRRLLALEFLTSICPGNGKGLDWLLGLTPAPYRHALAFAFESGFRYLARLPHACPMKRRHLSKSCADGILTIYRPCFRPEED